MRFVFAKVRLSENKTKENILFFAERKYFRQISLTKVRLSENKTRGIIPPLL